MQYKIPQNVGIEDRIVGPLTLKQLIIIAIGVGISYTLFAITNKIYEINALEYLILAFPAVLSAAFALIRINDIPLFSYILFFMEFSIKPKKRIWDHRGIAYLVAPELNEIIKNNQSEQNSIFDIQSKKAANLEELTRMLDSGGFEHLKKIEYDDIDSTKDDNLITQAYFGHKKGDSTTENMYWRTLDSHKKMLDMLAKISVTKIKEGTYEANIVKHEVEKIKEEVQQMKQNKDKTKNNRKKHKIPQPARVNNQVNTINKKKPAIYIPKQQNKKTENSNNNGEFDLRELQRGEIEINLD